MFRRCSNVLNSAKKKHEHQELHKAHAAVGSFTSRFLAWNLSPKNDIIRTSIRHTRRSNHLPWDLNWNLRECWQLCAQEYLTWSFTSRVNIKSERKKWYNQNLYKAHTTVETLTHEIWNDACIEIRTSYVTHENSLFYICLGRVEMCWTLQKKMADSNLHMTHTTVESFTLRSELKSEKMLTSDLLISHKFCSEQLPNQIDHLNIQHICCKVHTKWQVTQNDSWKYGTHDVQQYNCH